MKWCLLPGFDIYFRSWSHEHVIYHSGSCATHLLDDFGYHTLQCLKQGKGDIQMISQYVADALNLQMDEDLKDHISEVVLQLSSHRLLEPVTSENS